MSLTSLTRRWALFRLEEGGSMRFDLAEGIQAQAHLDDLSGRPALQTLKKYDIAEKPEVARATESARPAAGRRERR